MMLTLSKFMLSPTGGRALRSSSSSIISSQSPSLSRDFFSGSTNGGSSFDDASNDKKNPSKKLTRAPSSFSNKYRASHPFNVISYPKSTSSKSSDSDHHTPINFPSLWDHDPYPLAKLFAGNAKWREAKLAEDPEIFIKTARGQSPEYLLIGCSDSRVEAQALMGMDQGQLFIHRNIANVFVPTDLNLLSVIFYSVNVLKVKDIIVLGHYQCGGVRAASENKDLGLIEHWLSNIRDVQRLHRDELKGIEDKETRHRRLVELNVQEQCFKLFGNSIVQQMQAKTGRPRIHGLVYDIADGKLIDLKIDFKKIVGKYRDIYTVADFRHYTPVHIDRALALGKTSEGSEAGEGSPVTEGGAVDDVDRLVVIRRSDMDPSDPNSSVPRPIQCRGTTTLRQVRLAIQNLTGMPVHNQGLYKLDEVTGKYIVLGGIDNVSSGKELHDEKTLDEVGVKDICELELREVIVPQFFQK